MDDRLEQVLVVDHADDGEEHHEQGGERQRLFESMAQPVFLDNARESRRQHDDGQADQAHLGPVQGQGDDQEQRDQRLHHQRCLLLWLCASRPQGGHIPPGCAAPQRASAAP